jgi:hypothetical protein
MKGVTNPTSCRPIFKELNILTVTSLYILEVLSYFKKHNICTMKNSDLYKYDTRRKDLHVQSYNTLTCEKGAINMDIKLHNRLPLELRKVKGERTFQYIYSNIHTTLYMCSYQEDNRRSKNILS